jgi:hypothetical protein
MHLSLSLYIIETLHVNLMSESMLEDRFTYSTITYTVT